MLTDQQRMQIRRAIGHKFGFTRDSVDLIAIRNVPANIVIDRGRIEVEVDFSHPSGYGGSEVFIVNPPDGRTMPIIKRQELEATR